MQDDYATRSTPPKIEVERDGPVTTVILNRPEKRNAVDNETAAALVEAFRAFDANPAERVAVLWGRGGCFCAGADLAAIASGERSSRYGALTPTSDEGPMGPSRLRLSKPVIAAVAGYAVAGGMERALWGDLGVGEGEAVFGVFCRRFGVPLIDGGTVRLPRLIGTSRAMDLILTGRPVAADEAEAIGLANRVVEPGASRAAAEALAGEIAAFPQACVETDRASVERQWSLPLRDALAEEFEHGIGIVAEEGQAGASRFVAGVGRSGRFENPTGSG